MPNVRLHPVHDTEDREPEEGMAVCLSGGGYRAMLFHAGCLWRLHDVGLLDKLDRISSVSGGSITAAVLGMNWGERANFEAAVIAPIRKMASTTVDEGAIYGGIFLPGSISDHVAAKYSEVLFGNKTLQDLPDRPRFVINATNVQSGVLMRFSKPYMRDYRVGQILRPTLPLARAVAASSAFPPVLSPSEIKIADYGMHFEPAKDGEDLNVAPYTTDLILSDGGVYDNLGLETAWKRYKTIFVSDGGGFIRAEPEPHHDWARHAYRVIDVMNSQVRALRVRQLIALYESGERKGCYWGIGNDSLAATPTRLKAIDSALQERLIHLGYTSCDASLRAYTSYTG